MKGKNHQSDGTEEQRRTAGKQEKDELAVQRGWGKRNNTAGKEEIIGLAVRKIGDVPPERKKMLNRRYGRAEMYRRKARKG